MQNLPEIALSLTVFEINNIFISAKIQDGDQKSEKPKFFRGASGVELSTLRGQNLPEIALSFTVFEQAIFFISAKIQDGG